MLYILYMRVCGCKYMLVILCVIQQQRILGGLVYYSALKRRHFMSALTFFRRKRHQCKVDIEFVTKILTKTKCQHFFFIKKYVRKLVSRSSKQQARRNF